MNAAKEPSEPDPPPPDPPKPPEAGENGASASAEPILTLEQIARDVLLGNYGRELQAMLADEVATCLNQMSLERVIEIGSEESSIIITIPSDKNGSIIFDMTYIAPKILRGDFGSDARLAIQQLGGTASR